MERIVPEAAERVFLLNASQEEVYRYLREHMRRRSAIDETLPDAVQKELMARKEPIIDLALAQFGDCGEMISEILAKDDRDLRVAVLANLNRLQRSWVLQDRKTGLLPENVFDQLLSNGDGDELLAFFGNPHIDTDVLAEVFAREGKYAGLPDERWMPMVITALRNPQLQDWRALGDFADGLDLARHARPFDEIYKLLLRVEPSKRWAYNLFEEIFKLADWNPDTKGALANIGEEEPDPLSGLSEGVISKEWRESQRRGEEIYLKQVLKHWKTPPPEEDESRDSRFGESHDRLREAIVSRLPSHSDLIQKMFTYNDVWVRRGAYRVFRPSSPEELDRFYERDGLHFLEAAISNHNFFRNTSDSAAAISLKLYDLVMYGEGKPEDDTDFDFTPSQYNGQLQRLHEGDPSVYPLNPEAFGTLSGSV